MYSFSFSNDWTRLTRSVETGGCATGVVDDDTWLPSAFDWFRVPGARRVSLAGITDYMPAPIGPFMASGTSVSSGLLRIVTRLAILPLPCVAMFEILVIGHPYAACPFSCLITSLASFR